ncbi:MAG: class II glutamine amidotransferase, partial [Elusimicrobiota bacterium]
MCRLLGIKNFNYDSHKDLLEAFFALAETGNVLPGSPAGHHDGWGIGWYGNGTAKTEKSGGPASKEKERIFGILKGIGNSQTLIAHLRKSAWEGTSTAEHAHPFTFKNAIFAHNGTLLSYKELIPEIKAENLPQPEALDTEYLFRFIAQGIGRGTEKALRLAVKRTENMEFTSLNSLLSDGKSLIAYRSYRIYPDYYTLYKAELPGSAVVCSEEILIYGLEPEDIPERGFEYAASRVIKWSPLSNGE